MILSSTYSLALALVLAAAPPDQPAQPNPAEPTAAEPATAEPAAAEPTASGPTDEASQPTDGVAPVDIAVPQPSLGEASSDELAAARAEPAPAPALTPPPGPPYYTQADMDRLRARYGIPPEPRAEPRKPKWRCLIPDPVCGFGVELTATTAYAWRFRQGDISEQGAYFDWNSARVAYDVWVNFPAHTQTIGTYKYTRLTLGPKAAVVASDSHDLWGNFGLALRYWFGTRKWSPALEFTSALSFKLVGERAGTTAPQRSPIGITADIGVSIGGWGALIVGGQYDTPLAREELPEKFRVSAGGQVFFGFRGNILWGAPAAAAVGTHIAVQRGVTQP